jgi:hypothetical protein
MKIKIMCVIILLLTFQSNINILSEGDNMDLETIDKTLAAQMKKDFDKLLRLIFEDMKNKNYLRTDLTDPTHNDIMKQFYYMFLQFTNDHVWYMGQSVPIQKPYTFNLTQLELYDFEGGPTGDYSIIVKEIIAKKKEDMITELLESINN